MLKKTISNHLSITLCAMTAVLWAWACYEDVPLDSDPTTDSLSDEEADTMSDRDPLLGLVGNRYVLDFESSLWTYPAGLEEEIAMVVPTFAFEIVEVFPPSGTFTALLGTTEEGRQDPCNQTYRMTGALDAGDGATFVLGPMDIQTLLEGSGTKTLANLHGFKLTGRFAMSDVAYQGVGYEAGTIHTELDVREIYTIFDMFRPQYLCDAVAMFNDEECEACSFDPETDLCLTVHAQALSIPHSPELVLTEISEFDGACL